MKKSPHPKQFTIEDVAEAFYAGWTAIGAGPCETKEAAFKHWLRLWRGSEPFWMQDVRLAQRRLEAQRAAKARSRPAESE